MRLLSIFSTLTALAVAAPLEYSSAAAPDSLASNSFVAAFAAVPVAMASLETTLSKPTANLTETLLTGMRKPIKAIIIAQIAGQNVSALNAEDTNTIVKDLTATETSLRNTLEGIQAKKSSLSLLGAKTVHGELHFMEKIFDRLQDFMKDLKVTAVDGVFKAISTDLDKTFEVYTEEFTDAELADFQKAQEAADDDDDEEEE